MFSTISLNASLLLIESEIILNIPFIESKGIFPLYSFSISQSSSSSIALNITRTNYYKSHLYSFLQLESPPNPQYIHSCCSGHHKHNMLGLLILGSHHHCLAALQIFSSILYEYHY